MSTCENNLCIINYGVANTLGGGPCPHDASGCPARAKYLDEMKLKTACLCSIGDLSHCLGYAKSHCEITRKNVEMLEAAVDRVMAAVGINDVKEAGDGKPKV